MKKLLAKPDLRQLPLALLIIASIGCARIVHSEDGTEPSGEAETDGAIDDGGVARGGEASTGAAGGTDAQSPGDDSGARSPFPSGGTQREECGVDEFRNHETELCVPTAIQWVTIPGGPFEIGVLDGDSWEMPEAQGVTVATFEMTWTEVTVAQYRECVTAGECTSPGSCETYDNWGVAGRENHPVNCLDWNQAAAFCEWAGGRLPSEAEWEYAARNGGEDVDYPWGDERATCDYAVMTVDNEHGCKQHRTWEICSKPGGSTEQGLCDMAGNVWEWVADDFHSSYSGIPDDGSAWVDDPRNPSRIRRGGSLTSTFNLLRARYRSADPDSRQSFGVGFRCAK